MISVVSGWAITEWTVAVAAFLTAFGIIWRKMVVVRRFWRGFRSWMQRIETATTWTEAQMRTNGGSSLTDKVDQLTRHVALLLKHDDDRDQSGKRYAEPELPPREDTP